MKPSIKPATDRELGARVKPTPQPASPAELEALLAAITEAIEALVAWDNTAFESVVERQRRLCDHLATLDPASFSSATALQVRDLNRVYDRLLQHSIQWTHTIHAILEAGGHTFPGRASVHFRG